MSIKKQFTEAMNFRIAQMVEINKTIEEIRQDLIDNFNFKVSPATLSNQIKSIGYTDYDCRKFGNNSKNNPTHTMQSNSNPISKYKLKKMDDSQTISKEEAKKIGYDEDNNPLNFKLIYDSKTNELIDVELTITTENIKYDGGEEIQKLSERWWNIERMRFDMGNKFHPVLKGQRKGDWRGVVNRYNYTGDGHYRYGEIDIVKEQQEAWERLVDAVYDNVHSTLSKYDIDNNNKYIISGFSREDMLEMAIEAPEMIYRYIPTYLYTNIVRYCVDKMYEDRRVTIDDSYNILNAIKNIMNHIRPSKCKNELNKIDFELIKICLYENPNDFDLVIQYCCLYALNYGMVDKKYEDSLRSMIYRIHIRSVDDKYTLKGLDWLAVIGPHANDFKEYFERRDTNIKKFCEKYGLYQ